MMLLLGAVFLAGFVLGLITFAYLLALMQADLNQVFQTSPGRIAMPRKRKLQLVDGWRNAWRWFSVNCMAAAAAMQGAWLFVPDDMKATIRPGVLQYVTGGLLVLGIIGRLTKQSEAPKP